MSAIPSVQLLIVDDESAQMQALCDTLKDRGYAATGFTGAKEALAALRQQKFDLLLTDLMMPEMDGISLLREALQVDPHIVGIMMTGHGTIGTAVEAMQAGALDYILKPFKLSAVLPVLSRALTVRQLRVENAALQQRVAQRTAELEAANKELESFSYSVSHDLRAPLRVIEGYAKMLLEDSGPRLTEGDLRLLQSIASQADKMRDLIEGLLSLSRLGRQPLNWRPLQMTKLVKLVIDELAGERTGRNVEIKTGDLPDCVGDPALIKQVFVNLLTNALKFTRKKDPAVIEIGCRQQNSEQVYFVRDNGAGFDMQYAQRLFGAFQRLHRADEFEGTGIGLSIVQRIINRHGGRIWAEAEINKGATFLFTLPNHPPESPAA